MEALPPQVLAAAENAAGMPKKTRRSARALRRIVIVLLPPPLCPEHSVFSSVCDLLQRFMDHFAAVQSVCAADQAEFVIDQKIVFSIPLIDFKDGRS